MTDKNKRLPLGWLLLRDGHSVPVFGLSPEDLKESAHHAIMAPDVKLGHNRKLHAIVHQLGFDGDFGDYQRKHWPRIQALLDEHRCARQRDVLAPDEAAGIFAFGPLGPTRRQLADRAFLGNVPKRMFTGYGVDWAAWDEIAHRVPAGVPFPRDPDGLRFDPDDNDDRERAIAFALSHRSKLYGQWGFLDDKLVAPVAEHVVDKTYWHGQSRPAERERHLKEVRAVVRAFRAIVDVDPEGWVDLLPLSSCVILLRAHDGSWDLVWKDLRETPPPKPDEVANRYGLAEFDLPLRLRGETDLAGKLYFRRDAWAEKEAYEAEQFYYDQGGTPAHRRVTPDEQIVHDYLEHRGRVSTNSRAGRPAAASSGFREVGVGGQRLLVSGLVTVSEFNQMVDETVYLDRRSPEDENWTRANEGARPNAPVGVTWRDAQAYIAWLERRLRVGLRLPTLTEHRELRPFPSARFQELSGLEFPWEHYPPRPLLDGAERVEVPSAVAWSEPRFEEPGPGISEFSPANGITMGRTRKRWLADFPPAAPWQEAIPWGEHRGLRFIDAWDAYEWVQEPGYMAGRFWEGFFGLSSWGAYKNVKVGFRLVVDLT
jgi:hypothetical protein